MKLHVGNGSVYLRDWVNVDLPSATTFLAGDRPDLVEALVTDESNYYGRHDDKNIVSLRNGPRVQETVCDRYGSFGFLPVQPGTASHILAVQVFEHLDRSEARAALGQCFTALDAGGLLTLDIPDADETLRKYHETGDEFYIRHLFGPRRDMYGSHFHYTRQMLISLVESRGFDYLREAGQFHFYPAFTLIFRKP